ncbi:hypothetical protein Hanom_Chr05g00400121 [Helianthus anomalus]
MLVTMKKKKVDKSEKKKVEEPVTGSPRKQPSNLSSLDYVVVSDTLSSLDAGDKRAEHDPDDDATLTEIVKKTKVLENKKKELDEQAAAALAAKKSKLQKEATTAPSESEVDLAVLSAKPGNLLEKIYAASGSRAGLKPGKGTRKVDISTITPPTSLPSRTFDMSPSHADPGEKRKEDDVEVEKVGEGGAAGAGAGDGRGGGVDTEVESSEATPRHTIYTKRVWSSGEGGASGTHHRPEYERVQGGSWDTHNPTCADLPHTPRWNLTQGSRMTNLNNCSGRMDLLDDHIHARVNFYATSQDVAREWQLMGDDTLEFEAAKKALAEEREKINAEKKGETTRIREEAEKEHVVHQKREQEYIQCIAKLEKFAAEKVVESKAFGILAEEVTANCKGLLAREVPLVIFLMFELGQDAYNSGQKDGYGEGRVAAASNEKDYHFELYKHDCTAAYTAKHQEYEFIELGIVKAVEKLSRRSNAIEVLKKALGDQGTEGGVQVLVVRIDHFQLASRV